MAWSTCDSRTAAAPLSDLASATMRYLFNIYISRVQRMHYSKFLHLTERECVLKVKYCDGNNLSNIQDVTS